MTVTLDLYVIGLCDGSINLVGVPGISLRRKAPHEEGRKKDRPLREGTRGEEIAKDDSVSAQNNVRDMP
jgi:hypothetical protein